MKSVIISSIRNGGDLLDKWFKYHKNEGIDSFYVIDHKPHNDATSSVIAEHADFIKEKQGAFRQREWLKELSAHALKNHDIIFWIDQDEFLCGTNKVLLEAMKYEYENKKPRHLKIPNFNMVPLTPDQKTWQTYARPNKLSAGKTVFLHGQNHKISYSNGHSIKTDPPCTCSTFPELIASPIRSDATNEEKQSELKKRNVIISPLRSKELPFHILHYCFQGAPLFRERILAFLEGNPRKIDQMLRRYGQNYISNENWTSRQYTKDDLVKFKNALTNNVGEIYNKAVLASLVSASEVRPDVAEYFGETVPTWSREEHNKALRIFGAEERIIPRRFPKKYTVEEVIEGFWGEK